MGLISVSLPADGSTADVGDYNVPITTIVTLVNGNIDNSNVSSSAAIDGSKFADASITNAKLSTGAGQPGGAWTTYTPTLTNLSGGTITYAKYTQIGKTVHFRFKYTLAGAGVGTSPKFTVPVNTSADYTTGDQILSSVQLNDASGSRYTGTLFWSSASTFEVIYINSTTVTQTISASVPYTWAVSDQITVSGTYETT